MITKTAYAAFAQCPKRFWLAEHHPDLAAAPDLAAQRRLRAGLEVDRLARDRFPGGVPIPDRSPPADMATLRAQAIAGGAPALFQATFVAGDLLVRSDVLARAEGGWHLIEAKSSTRYKPEEHLPDVAFQAYVLQSAGLEMARAGLMHLNADCHYPDLGDLYRVADVSGDVSSFLPRVEDHVAAMRQIISRPDPPEAAIGRHCARPRECPFHAHCWQDVNGWTIYEVPYLRAPEEAQLEALGVRYVSRIPAGYAFADGRAAAFVDCINQRQILVDRPAIRAELAALVYPLHLIDFETIDYAVPRFDRCKPYQQVPFQYSCHILEGDGTLAHCCFLHTTEGDPRPGLVASLLAAVGEAGSLVAYHAPFERGILCDLADRFPVHADRLAHMAARLWDQLDIFRHHYRHHGFGGSNSLKSVLPVMAPGLTYESLAIQDGVQAQAVWEAMIGCPSRVEKERLVQQLRDYCALDTQAMVEIHRVLARLVSGA
jgi:CRISPR/Cas system-associated exonuclease Cas4 (RecB family)